MAKKPQTEEKAKGLVKGVGNYKGKTLNLSKKQLGAGGVKAAKARKVDISSTRYDKASKKVLGPKGQPLTGRVDLGGGNIAVYRNGVRVRAQAPSPKPKGGGGGGGGGNGGGGGGGGGEKPKAQYRYEERKAKVGAPGRPATPAGSTKARQAKFGGPGSSVQARQGKFGGGSKPQGQVTNPKYGKSQTAGFKPVGGRGVSQASMPNKGRTAKGYKDWEYDALMAAASLVAGGAGGLGRTAARGASAAARGARGTRYSVTAGRPKRAVGTSTRKAVAGTPPRKALPPGRG